MEAHDGHGPALVVSRGVRGPPLGTRDKFRYLKVGLSAVLAFVGAKMTAVDIVHVPPFVSLLVIVAILVIAIVASIRASRGATSPG